MRFWAKRGSTTDIPFRMSLSKASRDSISAAIFTGPLDESVKHPGILCPHGHFDGDTLGAWGRFSPDQQKRCATFARMGAVVFSYSMFGWGGESSQTA